MNKGERALNMSSRRAKKTIFAPNLSSFFRRGGNTPNNFGGQRRQR